MNKQKFDIKTTFNKPISKLTIRDLCELTKRDFIQFDCCTDRVEVFLMYPNSFYNAFADAFVCQLITSDVDCIDIIRNNKRLIVLNLRALGFIFTNDKDTTLNTLITKIRTTMGQFYEG